MDSHIKFASDWKYDVIGWESQQDLNLLVGGGWGYASPKIFFNQHKFWILPVYYKYASVKIWTDLRGIASRADKVIPPFPCIQFNIQTIK